MTPEPERWAYRLDAYRRACGQLAQAVATARARDLSELERGGVVQAFEFTIELGWKLLKDVLQANGLSISPVLPTNVVRAAFEAEIIEDGDAWMAAVKLRNKLSHVYSEEVVVAAVPQIVDRFGPVLVKSVDEIEAVIGHERGDGSDRASPSG